jgi:AcrR family transcriptional regulator
MTTEAHAKARVGADTRVPAKAPRTDTRQRILEVAAHLFATRGFAGTSIRDISDELGVTKAALYYHFTSKEVLLEHVVAQAFMSVTAVVSEQRDLTTREERARFIRDAIVAVSDCDPDVVAVMKDPSLAPLIHNEKASSGLTLQLAERLAVGTSGCTDIADVPPAHLMRAIAAVAAGYEALSNWHVAYPGCDGFADVDVDVIAGFVSDVLEAGRR